MATVHWTNGEMLITAISPGTATITCKGKQSGTSSTCQVTVSAKPVPVESIALSSTSISLVKNERRWLTATVKPDNATNKSVTWSSSNDNVAQVSNDGNVEGIGKGTATITCIANDGSGVKATCDVTIFNYGNYTRFTAKTIEGVDMQFYVDKYDSGVCGVIGPAIDANTVGTITIPNEVEGYKVTKIYNDAFKSCKGITKVTIPSSVESIGDYAFQYCNALSSVELGNGVNTIGSDAFSGCTSLYSITGGNNLESMGESAFANTPWSDNLPDGLNYMGKVLYKYKGVMPDNTTLNVKEGTKSIAYDAIVNQPGLYELIIPQSLKEIYGQSIYNCRNLSTITVDANNEVYDSRNGCNAIVDKRTNTIVLGSNKTTIPSTVTAIGRYAFCGRGIVEMDIPNQIDSIGELAFRGTSLKKVNIGKGLRTMNNHYQSVFYLSYSIEEITVNPDNPYFDSREDCNAIIETKTNKLVVGCSNTQIPKTVRVIGDGAFNGTGCDMVSLTIPDNIEEIGIWAFANQNSLRSVTIGKGVKKVGWYGLGARNIKVVRTLSEKAIDLDMNGSYSAFNLNNYTYYNGTLYVPIGSKASYMVAQGWSKFNNIVETDGNTLYDGDIFSEKSEDGQLLHYEITDAKAKTCAMIRFGNNASGEITIPSEVNGYHVTIVGSVSEEASGRVGYGSGIERHVTSISIPEGATGITDDAFAYLKDLASVTISSTVDSIGMKAFYECNNISSVVSYIEDPFDIDESVFSADNENDNTFNKAILYVPKGAKAKYLAAEGWKMFRNIVEGEPTIGPEPTLKGDVNEDEKVNGTDLVALTNIILGKSPEKASADVNGDEKVNGTDYVALVNIILGKASSRSATADDKVAGGSATLDMEVFAISAGETNELTINLTNPNDALTLLQFDMVLPKGLSVLPTMTVRTNQQSHRLTAYENGNKMRFLLASSSNELIEGTEAAVVRMTVTADADFDGGVIALQDILGVSPDEQEVYMPTRQYNLVGGTTGINKIGVGQNGSTVYNLSGQRLAALKKGVNIIDGKKVVKK